MVALRADIDALPIDETNELPFRSQVKGVMHACGHDAHTAMLLGAAEVLAGLKARLPGTVVFLFQPAEEGAPEGEEGGALLMVKEGALDDPKVEAVFGLHVGSWASVGQAGFSDGPIFASSDSFPIEVEGKTVHGAQPHMGLDPIPVAAEIVQALQLIVSRQVDGRQPRVLTIGRIQGGTRFNIIAGRVTMDGTMRTHDATVRADMKARMARTVKGVAEAHGTTATLRFLDEGNPPTVNDAALAERRRPRPPERLRRGGRPRRAADGGRGLPVLRGRPPTSTFCSAPATTRRASARSTTPSRSTWTRTPCRSACARSPPWPGTSWPAEGSGRRLGRPRGADLLVLVLELVEPPVHPAPREQLLVRPPLADPSLVEDEDLVHVLHRGEPVGDHDRGPAPSSTRSASWMSCSVSVSTEEVASSRMRTRGSWASARAKERSCFCPTERVAPRSFTSVS